MLIVDPRGGEQRVRLDRSEYTLGRDPSVGIHLNDSMKQLGTRVDRHERIGKGHIGENGFRAILRQEIFADVPGILETQPLPDSAGRYLSQVRLLKKLAGREL